ncbi:class I SAM-dependent methyltransferase [Achromobacter sp.]|uniref:class I SAM-dependent methyltransferase n=1 Tax=Achromobacter sp. TaxID=134375 RepID=UPI002F91E653
MITGNLWGYWAHLSIYTFALPWVKGLHVLEAGTGAGYGADYFMRNGAASVAGFDASSDAVSYAKARYPTPGLTYEVADLNKGLPTEAKKFDVVFSSNVFEHVAQIDTLIAGCTRVLKDGGVAIIAVPPVITEYVLERDIRNHFHVHHIPPSAWHAKLSRFFESVVYHRHLGAGEYSSDKREQEQINLPADQVTIRETDFEFPQCDVSEMDRMSCITSIYVCTGVRSSFLPETIAERTKAEWAEGAVAAKVIAEGANRLKAAGDENKALSEELARLRIAQTSENRRQGAEVSQLRYELSAMKNSKSWKITGPLRSMMSMVKRGK